MSTNNNLRTSNAPRLIVRRLSSRTSVATPVESSITSKVSDNLPTPPAPQIEQAPVEEPAEVPVQPEAELVVVETPPVSVEEESSAQPAISEGTAIEDLPISSVYKRYLKSNNLSTIEQIEAFLAAGNDLVDLKEIGTKSAKAIKEGLEVWQSEQKKTLS